MSDDGWRGCREHSRTPGSEGQIKKQTKTQIMSQRDMCAHSLINLNVCVGTHFSNFVSMPTFSLKDVHPLYHEAPEDLLLDNSVLEYMYFQ